MDSIFEAIFTSEQVELQWQAEKERLQYMQGITWVEIEETFTQNLVVRLSCIVIPTTNE